jgi:hypothetical protein
MDLSFKTRIMQQARNRIPFPVGMIFIFTIRNRWNPVKYFPPFEDVADQRPEGAPQAMAGPAPLESKFPGRGETNPDWSRIQKLWDICLRGRYGIPWISRSRLGRFIAL